MEPRTLEPVLTAPPENVAEQQTIEMAGFTLPAVAFDKAGAATLASLVDMIVLALALLDHAAVNELLEKNSVVVRDLNGRVIFPRAKTEQSC